MTTRGPRHPHPRPVRVHGKRVIDDGVLAEAGTTDLSTYGYQEGTDLQLDVFVDDWGAFAPA
jgi:hypothetical protein